MLPPGKLRVRTPETQALVLPWEPGPCTSCRGRRPRHRASLCISVLGGARPSVPCSHEFNILSCSVAGDAHSEAEAGLHAGAVGLCSASVQNALDCTKHAGKLGDEAGMPVCGARRPTLLGCCGLWGTMLPLLPCPLLPSSVWVKHLHGFGSWVVSKPSSGLPNQQVSRYTMGLLMPQRSED